MKYGLIGYPLSHSFSPGYFAQKFSDLKITASYKAYPLKEISQVCDLVSQEKLHGLNVTIPYKEAIIPYLDHLDFISQSIGAVNTVKIIDGQLSGFNTDAYGFEKSLSEWLTYDDLPAGALILGTGGASKAVAYTLEKLAIPYHFVSRSAGKGLTYQDIDTFILSTHPLLINTSPVGMYPNENMCPSIPYHLLNEKNMLYDLVYNPKKTLFLSEGMKQGCMVKNGFDMLIYQADKAWEIWNSDEQ
jgi:shikimate dehydrogenase